MKKIAVVSAILVMAAAPFAFLTGGVAQSPRPETRAAAGIDARAQRPRDSRRLQLPFISS